MLEPEDLLSRFQKVKKSGGSWTACCPAHDDKTPSLSMSRGDDGRWLLKCHAGCSQNAVLQAANLEAHDLFPKPNHPLRQRIVATYDYTDEQGDLLHQVVRYDPKEFRQRRPDGNGDWEWNMKGVRRVLYQLDALQHKTTVFIVEGEKDADCLAALNLQATCNSGGAGKWRDSYTEQLTAAGITTAIVIPDNDPPGYTHAQGVATSCHLAGIKTKLLRLPGARKGDDLSDFLTSHRKDELLALGKAAPLFTPETADAGERPDIPAQRTITLTAASSITVRPVRWLWDGRLALGTLGLLGGREGAGKTTCAYTISADITRGTLPGVYLGKPHAVIMAATEDSWQHTIVPRLIAADANLDLVFRVDVVTPEATETAVSLPLDLVALEREVRKVEPALILLDPLLSRLARHLDTHKDAEVRLALEPLVRLADAVSVCVLGIIHVNKGHSTDPLTLLMGSRAFAAVARSVLFLMTDPEDAAVRLLGQPKNNLGRTDLPTLQFRIVEVRVAETEEGDVLTAKLEWLGETDRSITEAIDATAASVGDRTATSEAADWLHDYLTDQGPRCKSAAVKQAGRQAGHSVDALKRARQRLRVESVPVGFPRQTYWELPQSEQQPKGDAPTAPTAPTALTKSGGRRRESTAAPIDTQLVQSVQWGQSGEPAPTGAKEEEGA